MFNSRLYKVFKISMTFMLLICLISFNCNKTYAYDLTGYGNMDTFQYYNCGSKYLIYKSDTGSYFYWSFDNFTLDSLNGVTLSSGTNASGRVYGLKSTDLVNWELNKNLDGGTYYFSFTLDNMGGRKFIASNFIIYDKNGVLIYPTTINTPTPTTQSPSPSDNATPTPSPETVLLNNNLWDDGAYLELGNILSAFITDIPFILKIFASMMLFLYFIIKLFGGFIKWVRREIF